VRIHRLSGSPRRGRSGTRATLATFVASVTAVGLTATGSPAFAAAKTKAAPQKSQAVIVVLRDQLAKTPARRSALSARTSAGRVSQSAVLHRLAGPKPKDLKQFGLVNAFSATVTAAQATALAHDPAVASVTPDQLVTVAPSSSADGSSGAKTAKPHVVAPAAATPAPVAPGACSSDPKNPVLEPEALQTINARSSDPSAKTAAALGIDGSGVKVGFIADGINPNNPGFIRSDGTSSIVDYKDFYGDGPNAVTSGAEAFGDASAISAQGNVVYDVADYANPNVVSFPGGHCYIKIVGVAPGADVVALKAGSELLPNSAILQAIDYAVRVAHVDVLNESFGANLYPDSSARNTIQMFDDMATAAGVTVTVSTGDAGVTSTIGNPGTDPNLISAGAITDSRLYEQTGYALATRFSNGSWLDDNISSLSSAGVTQNGRTIDLSAPGEADWAVCDNSGNFVGCTSWQGSYSQIQAFGGTSQAAPMTAGTAALVIQAFRKTHGGASPTPALVKEILTSTAHDLGLPGSEQGSGVLDARAAVEAALTYPGNGVPDQPGVSSNVLVTPGQLTLTGTPGSNVTGQVAVTNVGQSPVTVLPATRTEATLSHAVQTAAISASSAQTTPYPTSGAPWVYTTKTFTVPSGADRLNATILWQSGAGFGGAGPVVRLSLFDPSGTYAANTRPQGGAAPANYGNVDVRQPKPGTWTAVLYTPAGASGFTGNVTLQTDTLRNMPAGTVSPSLVTLAPGQQQTLSVTMRVPADGGDSVNTVSIASSGGHETAVPVVLRALVDTAKGYGTFSGNILGGNARSFSPAQTLSYAFDVPSGKKDLDIITSLTTDRGDLLETVLVDPAGETPSIASNVNPDASDTTGDAINVVAAPAPGRWRFVIVVQSPVSGREISQAIKGHVMFNQQSQNGAIPTSGQVLPRGVAHSVTLTVHNPRPVAIGVQTDARTNDYALRQLAPQFAGSTVPLPLSVDDLSNIPGWLVPPDTTHLDLSSAATVPAQVELSSPGNGIDVFGDLTAAQGGSTVSTANVNETLPEHVAQGFWGDYVQEIGPYGDSGAPAGSAHLVANAFTKGFDTSVTSSTGDPYRSATNAAISTGTPTVIPAHGSATITVTFTPNAGKGTLINGVLHLVIPPVGVAGLFNTTGDVIATVPYSYRVG
jgi:hypothetical protein